MNDKTWRLDAGSGPLIATAVHDGHELRDEVAEYTALDDLARLREEDPFTGHWAGIVPTRVIGLRSRFEMDLNRPRDNAIYRKPEDAWGLTVWKENPPEAMFKRSLDQYDAFYTAMKTLFDEATLQYGRFVVFDIHTYNHLRLGADGPEADKEENPQVNIGTGTMDRTKWAPVVDAFMDSLRAFDFPGGALDVRENVKFRGGNWPRWIHENYPDSAVAISIEFKKFFMDEWAGTPDHDSIEAIRSALQSTVAPVLDALSKL
jgi:N-formylglutamate deformylase